MPVEWCFEWNCPWHLHAAGGLLAPSPRSLGGMLHRHGVLYVCVFYREVLAIEFPEWQFCTRCCRARSTGLGGCLPALHSRVEGPLSWRTLPTSL